MKEKVVDFIHAREMLRYPSGMNVGQLVERGRRGWQGSAADL